MLVSLCQHLFFPYFFHSVKTQTEKVFELVEQIDGINIEKFLNYSYMTFKDRFFCYSLLPPMFCMVMEQEAASLPGIPKAL